MISSGALCEMSFNSGYYCQLLRQAKGKCNLTLDEIERDLHRLDQNSRVAVRNRGSYAQVLENCGIWFGIGVNFEGN